MSFHSSVTKLGKLVTQKIHFTGGNERTYNGIITSTIRQDNGFTQMILKNGMILTVNTKNVNSIRTKAEDDTNFDEAGTLSKFGLDRELAGKAEKIIHFSSGKKETENNVIINTIKIGEFIKMDLSSGEIWSVNTPNVDCIETIFPSSNL